MSVMQEKRLKRINRARIKRGVAPLPNPISKAVEDNRKAPTLEEIEAELKRKDAEAKR